MEVCVAVGILRPTATRASMHSLRAPTKTHHTRTMPNLGQERTDACEQELNVAETERDLLIVKTRKLV
jgi:hypothetical protein